MRRAAALRQRAEHDRDVVLAWQIERVAIMALQQKDTRRLPALRKVLERTSARQTPDEQRAIVYGLSASLGTPLQRMKKGTNGRYYIDRAKR